MKTRHLARVLLLAALLGHHAQAAQYLFLSHQKASPLTSFKIHPKTGKLTEHDTLELPGTGGPMTLTRDGKYLYVESQIVKTGHKKPAPHVASVQVIDGKFKLLHVAEIRYRVPGMHVDETGKWLLGAHYGQGAVSIWNIDAKHHCTGELAYGQETAPRAHFITTDPTGRFVYVPHTEPNAVYQFRLDTQRGRLQPLDPPSAQGPDKDHQYHEPRHYAHHPTLDKAYTSNERGGGISLWNYDPKTGQLQLEQTICTLPEGFEGRAAGADVEVTPDGKFAYMSNRDYTKRPEGDPQQDTLAGYRLAPDTGRMTYIDNFPAPHAPRAFCIDRSGQFIFAAGQIDNTLVTYRIEPDTGKLRRLAIQDTAERPIWVMTHAY